MEENCRHKLLVKSVSSLVYRSTKKERKKEKKKGNENIQKTILKSSYFPRNTLKNNRNEAASYLELDNG